MANLFKLEFGKLSDMLGKLAQAGLTAEMAEEVRKNPALAEIVVNALRGAMKTNGNSPFTAPIVYVQPEFEELKRRFPAYVNPDYEGKRFDPIERCKAVSKENREVAFEYVHMRRDASIDEVLAEMDRKGLLPALYEELLGFDQKYPDEPRKYPIIALGSEAVMGCARRVACLSFDDEGRNLYLDWVHEGWRGFCRFLAVHR